MVFRHVQRIDRQHRLLAGEVRDSFRAPGQRIERPARKPHARRLAAHQRTDHRQHLVQTHVLAAQDVILADAALAEREQMARRHIIDMHEVEPGIDEGRHAAIGRLHDDAPGRGRLDVARADRGGRADDHDGKPLAGHALHQPLGDELGFLIGADDGLFAVPRGLVDRGAGDRLQRRDGGGVDDALHTGSARGVHHDAGAFEIVAHDLLRIGGPDPVIGGGVEDVAHAVHRRDHRRTVAHVALRDLEFLALDVGADAGRTHQHADPVAAARQGARDGGADKSRRAGDQDLVAHQPAPPSARRPSKACQASSTGTPITMSRARLSSETARPISGPRPNSGISAA